MKQKNYGRDYNAKIKQHTRENGFDEGDTI